jgi:F-type H+-transporting ATPase subunit b
MDYLTSFKALAVAAAETANPDVLTSLGIDWQLLVLQIVAFLILVVILGKFVYPVFVRIIDERQEQIEAGTKAAHDAEKKAARAEKEVEKLLKEARTQAKDIVQTAKEEAVAAIEAAEGKAKQKAEAIVASAKEQIEKDVIAAQKTLHNETLDLVALATEKVVGGSLSDKVDSKVIAAAVKEAR